MLPILMFMTQKNDSFNYERSRSCGHFLFLCAHTQRSQVADFVISLKPELSLLGNQSVIHHYLSSTQKGPTGLRHMHIN